jgi:hypothetical protein
VTPGRLYGDPTSVSECLNDRGVVEYPKDEQDRSKVRRIRMSVENRTERGGTDITDASRARDRTHTGEAGGQRGGRLRAFEVLRPTVCHQSIIQRIPNGGRGRVQPNDTHFTPLVPRSEELPVGGDERQRIEIRQGWVTVVDSEVGDGESVSKLSCADTIGATHVEHRSTGVHVRDDGQGKL